MQCVDEGIFFPYKPSDGKHVLLTEAKKLQGNGDSTSNAESMWASALKHEYLLKAGVGFVIWKLGECRDGGYDDL